MNKILLPWLALCCLSLSCEVAFAQRWSVDTTCLRLYFPDSISNAHTNPYLVMVDTCHGNRPWMMRGAEFACLRRKTLHVALAPADSIVEVSWTAVDSSETELRAGLKLIYDSIGPFVIRKNNPQDSFGVYGYSLHFSSYVPCDTFTYYWMPLGSYTAESPVIPFSEESLASPDAIETALIYPVPARGILNCAFRLRPRKISVVNIEGQTLGCSVSRESETTARIDVSQLRTGAYWLRVDKTFTRFLVK
jgi:hypothetical protein